MKKIAVLGPAGTFSEMAARQHFGAQDSAALQFVPSIYEVFEAVKKDAAYGVVPIENMLDGSIGEALDGLYHSNLKIIAEIVIPIHHSFAVLPGVKMQEVKTAVSIQKALAQCLSFINKYRLIKKESLSTSAAAQEIAGKKVKDAGAICTEIAARRYGLQVLVSNIEDNKDNVTRFAVIAKSDEVKKKGAYKTSIAVHPHADRPGLLYTLLKSFAARGINLTKIESRPTKFKLGEYIFYIDIGGHAEDKNIHDALHEIQKSAQVKILGSYLSEY